MPVNRRRRLSSRGKRKQKATSVTVYDPDAVPAAPRATAAFRTPSSLSSEDENPRQHHPRGEGGAKTNTKVFDSAAAAVDYWLGLVDQLNGAKQLVYGRISAAERSMEADSTGKPSHHSVQGMDGEQSHTSVGRRATSPASSSPSPPMFTGAAPSLSTPSSRPMAHPSVPTTLLFTEGPDGATTSSKDTLLPSPDHVLRAVVRVLW